MGRDHPIATVVAGEWGDEPGIPYGEIPESVARANARLIAAAPALLDALERISHQLPTPSYGIGRKQALAMLAEVADFARRAAAIARQAPT
jgi:hypothetical protein